MDELEFLALLESLRADAVDFHDSEVQKEQDRALDLYNGEPFGDEVEGRSQVISRDVAEVVDWTMPDLMRIFASGDRVVFFRPETENDVETAEHATEYVNHIFWKDNNGFDLLYDFGKDGLLQKNGIFKCWWEEKRSKKRTTFSNLSITDLGNFRRDEDISVLSVDERELNAIEIAAMSPDSRALYSDGKSYTIEIERDTDAGRIRVDVVPPEEFLITPRSTSIDDAPYCAHRTLKSKGDLVAEGLVTAEEAENLTGEKDVDIDDRRDARFNNETDDDERPEQGLMEEVWVFEEYVRVDFDGDDFAELRQVIRVGEDILSNEIVDEHPFADWTPNRLPHRFWGRSQCDELGELQRINSVLMRQVLDNLYLTNTPRKYVNMRRADESTIDDMLNTQVGGVVRGDGPMAEVVGEFTVPYVAGNTINFMELLQTQKEMRTGVTRLKQGLDEDIINKTATGISRLMQAAQGRKELIARRMANGLAHLFGKVLRLVIKYQDFEREIRLRDKFVKFDPRFWNADMDVDVLVGLGSGNKEEHIQSLLAILSQQKEAAANGLFPPDVMRQKMLNTFDDLVEAMGLPSARRYMPDATVPIPEPGPSEEEIEAKTKIQVEVIKGEIALRKEAIREALKRDELDRETILKLTELDLEAKLKQQELVAEGFFEGVRSDPPNVDERLSTE